MLNEQALSPLRDQTSLLGIKFLAKINTLMMPQPPYSPDVVPCDLFMFQELKLLTTDILRT